MNRGTFSFPGKTRSQPQDYQAIGHGLASQRPPAGFPGRMWFSTDSGIASVDDGLSWNALGAHLVTLLAANYTDSSTTTRASDQLVQSATVAAGTMAVGDALRARFQCTFQNTGGSNETFTPKLRIGSTTVLASSSGFGTMNAGAAAAYVCDIEFLIYLVSLTSLRCMGRLTGARHAAAPPGTAGIIGGATYGASNDQVGVGYDTTGAENFANATAVGLVVNMSNAGTPTSTFTVKNWTLERLAA